MFQNAVECHENVRICDKYQITFQNTVKCQNMQDNFRKYFKMRLNLRKYLKMSELTENASKCN